MRVVIDTNIVFSALLTPSGTISDILFNSGGIFDIHAPTELIEELDVHSEKLKSLSGYSTQELRFLRRQLQRKIEFIDLSMIRQTVWRDAFELTQNIDEFDTPFVALSLELEALLWTGDRKLTKGLRTKGATFVVDTAELAAIRNEVDGDN